MLYVFNVGIHCHLKLEIALLRQINTCISSDERFCIVIYHFNADKNVSKKTEKYTFSRSCQIEIC